METTISHTEIIDAPIKDVWKHLLFKIDHPEHFVPNVSGVEILEKNDAATIRKMTVTLPTQTMTIVEKITATPYVVKFEIIEHPTFTGNVDNLAEAIDEHNTIDLYDELVKQSNKHSCQQYGYVKSGRSKK
jgi:carbon monoxide dehydrogenase subunit G